MDVSLGDLVACVGFVLQVNGPGCSLTVSVQGGLLTQFTNKTQVIIQSRYINVCLTLWPSCYTGNLNDVRLQTVAS